MFANVDRPNQRSVLDPNDPYDGLTSKQQKFVELSFSGLSDLDAYRQAYDCSAMTDATIKRKAVELAHAPLVTAKIRQLQDKRDSQSTLAANLTRDWITRRIMKIADKGEKESNQLRALELLGKHVGIDLFRETTRVERVERTPEDIDAELETQLRSIATTLEGKARDVTPKPAAPAPRKGTRLKPTR